MATRKDDWVSDLEKHPEQWESDPAILAFIKGSAQTKDSRINIRVPAPLIEVLRKKAQQRGLAYQTYIYSELYKLAFSARDVDTELNDLKKRLRALEAKRKKQA